MYFEGVYFENDEKGVNFSLGTLAFQINVHVRLLISYVNLHDICFYFGYIRLFKSHVGFLFGPWNRDCGNSSCNTWTSTRLEIGAQIILYLDRNMPYISPVVNGTMLQIGLDLLYFRFY